MPQEVLPQEMDSTLAIHQGLKARIGSDRYELWFGTHVRFELTDDLIIAYAANSFLMDRLRRQFATDLELVARIVTGRNVRAQFRDRSTLEGQVECEPASLCTTSTAVAGQPVAAAIRSDLRINHVQSGNHPGASATPGSRRRVLQLSTFVVGSPNRVAYTAAQSCIERPGVASPLFLYGPPGSGKTHLLEGICNASRARGSATRALYLSADQFTSYFLEALQGSGLPNFRRKCREVDLLAIDDIHFFAGKKATMLEFQHTLDALARQGRQVIVAADRAPAELGGLGAELATRLTGGLVCGIESADQETRLGITRQLVERSGRSIPDEVIRLIAHETSGDARQIQGALNRLHATSDALKQPISLELANSSLQDIFSSARRLVHLPDVERAVCEVFGMESKALRDGKKTKSISQPRMLAMWLSRRYTRAAFSEIGEYFGRRSHSTVISAERKVERWVADGAKLQLGRACWSVEDAIRRIETKLRTG